MPLPLIAVGALAKAKAFVSSKWFIVGILALSLVGGVYFTLNHWKDDAVSNAVETSAQSATIRSYETKDAISARTEPIDRKFDRLHDQTTKDFADARNKLKAAPPAERDAQAPRILIDTINELDRLRGARDADGVPDPAVRDD